MCAISSVAPSLGCCAAYSAARTPATPALVSTMTCWFHICVSLAATTRASASVPPPGGKPTTMRTGAFGHSWATRRGAARRGERRRRRPGGECVVASFGSCGSGEESGSDARRERQAAAASPARAGWLAKCSIAACTPLPARRTPASFRPISQPARVGEQGQVVAVAEVADAEHAALDLAQAGAEREVEALVDEAAHRVGVDAGRHDHAGQHRRVGAPARRTGSAAPRRRPRRARLRPSAGGARTRCRGPRRAASRAPRRGRRGGWCSACTASSRRRSWRRSRPRPRTRAAASPSSPPRGRAARSR